MGFSEHHKTLKRIKENINPTQNLEKGISVVIPIYDGIDYIEECLSSLSNQNIKNAKYEVIVILNGIFTRELNYLHNSNFNNLDILVLINDVASAGSARNIGMKSAKYSHVTFVDIDDYVSPDYIQSNYDFLEENTITVSQIFDVLDNEVIQDSLINEEVVRNDGIESVPVIDLNRIASITVCKVIPKEIILLQNFKDHLRSGEDTVFYSELFVNSRPKLKVVPIDRDAIYFRRIREDSVSRKSESFDFLVFQRLEILEILDDLLNQINNPTLKKFVKSKYNAQISFMNKFLKENPASREKVLESIEMMSLKNFNYSILNRDLAKTLVLSYCFPPFSDTSATIVSKRLIKKNEVVDVVSNNMSRIRHQEQSLNKMIRPLVGKKVTVNQPASFSSMYYLNSYVDAAVKFYINNEEYYQTVYSRAMFPISHIPNLFIKIINPGIHWIAEFSDPLLYNIESNERKAEIKNDVLVKSLKNGLLGIFSKYVNDNLFNLSELIPFALADELIFTNENQLEFMVSRFSNEEQDFIRKKSVISNHPTLPKEYYYLEESKLNIEESIVNIAYFGNFYSRRGYHQFIELIRHLNKNFNLIFKLHLYTNKNQLSEESLKELTNNNVNINEYLSFTEFLNASTKYDLLLISDAKTREDKPYNPYLPSKLSDYLGSGKPILALTEITSVMSKMENELIYKIDISEFEQMISKNTLKENKILIDLVKYISSEKTKNNGRKLKYNDDVLVLSDDAKLMEISKELTLFNISSQDWLIKPKTLPVSTEKNYFINLNNTTENIKIFEVMSFYSLPRVIKVDFIDGYNNLVESLCISELRKRFHQFEIEPNSTFTIRLRYRKNYDKLGFLDAGRLRIKGI